MAASDGARQKTRFACTPSLGSSQETQQHLPREEKQREVALHARAKEEGLPALLGPPSPSPEERVGGVSRVSFPSLKMVASKSTSARVLYLIFFLIVFNLKLCAKLGHMCIYF